MKGLIMAKKQKSKFNSKNVKINEEELSITKIGEMDTINQSSTFVLILFGLILIFIFFLPTITNLIKGEDNEKVNYTESEPTPSENEEQENKDNNEPTMYTITPSLSIPLEENIQLDAFSLNGNTLSYQINNTSPNRFDFDEENYYLELYSEDDTLLARILLDTNVARTTSTMETIVLNGTTATNAKKILFVKKEESDYPNVELQKNAIEEDILVCSSTIETITYKFKEDKLFEIQDNVNVNSTNTNYISLLNEWKTKSETLNAMNGVNSLLVDAGTSFAVNTSVDLQTAKVSKEDSKYYYEKDTLAKVVNFEMEARGFSCN